MDSKTLVELADEELVRQAQAGDEGAMHELHRRYYDGLFALALRWLRDETRARDAVLEAFGDAFSSIRRFKGRSKFSTWLFKLARSRIIRQQEQAGRERLQGRPVDAQAAAEAGELCAKSAEEVAGERQAFLEVVRLIQQLEPEQAAALTLRFVVGLSLAETAQVLSISEAAAGMRITRGRERLKAMLLRREREQA
ncbi:MAG: RNA polymerase sigma factor [candidate division WOR-3 bacterium]